MGVGADGRAAVNYPMFGGTVLMRSRGVAALLRIGKRTRVPAPDRLPSAPSLALMANGDVLDFPSRHRPTIVHSGRLVDCSSPLFQMLPTSRL